MFGSQAPPGPAGGLAVIRGRGGRKGQTNGLGVGRGRGREGKDVKWEGLGGREGGLIDSL